MKNLNLIVMLIVASALLAIGWQIGRIGRQTELDEYRTRMEAWQDSAEIARAQSDSISRIVREMEDSVQVVVREMEEHEAAADSLKERTDLLQIKLDSLQEEMDDIDLSILPPVVVTYIETLEVQNVSLKLENHHLTVANELAHQDARLWQGIAMKERARADLLQIVVDAVPTDVPDNEKLFGVIPIPSRTVSFISGVAVGTLAVVVVSGG